MTAFEIRETAGNKTGSLPPHWDVYLSGQDDSLLTVWDSEAMAQLITRLMEEWGRRRGRRG